MEVSAAVAQAVSLVLEASVWMALTAGDRQRAPLLLEAQLELA